MSDGLAASIALAGIATFLCVLVAAFVYDYGAAATNRRFLRRIAFVWLVFSAPLFLRLLNLAVLS